MNVPGGAVRVLNPPTHEAPRGPRDGVILSRAEPAKKINSTVVPGQQGGPLEHVIAAKAVAFGIAAAPAPEPPDAGGAALRDRVEKPAADPLHPNPAPLARSGA